MIVGWYAIGQGDDGYYFLKKATYNSYMQTLQGAYTPEKEAPHKLLAMTKGYVWEKEVTQEELKRIKKSRISNLTIIGEGTYLVRVVAKRAAEGWRQANPTMEDVYLLYFVS